MVPADKQQALIEALYKLHAERDAAILRARERERRIGFVDFCRRSMVRSDDPEVQGAIPWAPWAFLIERAIAWEKGASEVILKARQLGLSDLVARYLSWRARYGAQCGVISVGQREARDLLRRMMYIENHLPKDMRTPIQYTADAIRYPASEGAVLAFPSTEQAGISYTFNVVVMDEAAFHPWGAANYTAMRPTLSAGGQFIALSTADPTLGPSGFFHDLYWDSRARKTPYQSVFIPWSARPGRDAQWYDRERAAFPGLKDEFDAYYPADENAAFVARSGLVYPQFFKDKHVREASVPMSQCRRLVAGIDFGGGDPTAIVVMGLTPSHDVHAYAEFYKSGAVGVDQLARFLARYPGIRVVCDPSEPVAIATLQGYGIDAVPADNRRGEGLGQVAFLLEHDRLTISPECANYIEEFKGYRWAERVDPNDRTRYRTRTPVGNHADAQDASRYAIMELLVSMRPMFRLPTRTLGGKRLTTEAV